MPGIQPLFLAEQALVSLVLMTQSHIPSLQREYGSAILHCKSVTQGRPRLMASSALSTRVLIPVVVGGTAKM